MFLFGKALNMFYIILLAIIVATIELIFCFHYHLAYEIYLKIFVFILILQIAAVVFNIFLGYEPQTAFNRAIGIDPEVRHTMYDLFKFHMDVNSLTGSITLLTIISAHIIGFVLVIAKLATILKNFLRKHQLY